MADIRTLKGTMIRSEDVERAWFWEAGANFEECIVGEPHNKALEDTLRLQMKDPENKKTDIEGPHARRMAEDLKKAGVPVFHPKK